MTMVRSVVKGEISLVTRRCLNRQFIFAPGEDLNALWHYLLVEAAQYTGVTLLAWVVMSDHYHVVVHDPNAQLPKLTERLHGHVARCVNRLRGRKGYLWDERQTSVVGLGDAFTVMGELAYLACNPVECGAVKWAREWPGVKTQPGDYTAGPRTVRRPDVAMAIDSTLPEEVTYELAVPPTHAHLSRQAFAERLAKWISGRERKLHSEARLEGKTFGSPREVLRVPWTHQATSEEKGSGLSPTVAAACKKRRAAMLLREKVFRRRYHEARLRFIAGERDVVFPGGTWKMVVVYGLPAEPHPPPAWVGWA